MKKELKRRISAGGVVRKVIKGKVYIVLMRDSSKHDWILPKGHLKKDESIEEAALRETREETGLQDIKVIQKLGVKERVSFEGDEYKTIHYFLFECEGDEGLEKTIDNDKVFEPKWFPLDNLPKLFWQEQKEIIRDNLDVIKTLHYS